MALLSSIYREVNYAIQVIISFIKYSENEKLQVKITSRHTAGYFRTLAPTWHSFSPTSRTLPHGGFLLGRITAGSRRLDAGVLGEI